MDRPFRLPRIRGPSCLLVALPLLTRPALATEAPVREAMRRAAARLLIEHGADVNAKGEMHDSPYRYAGAEGRLEILRMTLAACDRWDGPAGRLRRFWDS